MVLRVDDIATFTGELTTVEHGGALEATVDLEGALSSPEGNFDVAFQEGNFGEVEITEALLKGNLAGTRVVIAEASAETSEGSLSFSGGLEVEREAGLYRLRLNDLSLAREGLELGLDSPAEAVYSSGEGLSVDSFHLSGPPGSIRLSGEMPREGDATLTLEVSDLTGEGWLEEFVGDRFSFRGANLVFIAEGTPAEPRLALSGSVDEILGKGAAVSLAGEVEAEYAGEVIRVKTFRWTAGEGRSLEVTGTVPFDPLGDDPFRPGEISLDGSLAIEDLKSIAFLLPPRFALGGGAEGTLRVSGSWGSLVGDLRMKLRNVEPPDGFKPAPPGPIEADLSLSLSGGEVDFHEISLDSPKFSLNAGGSWAGTATVAGLVRGEDSLLQGTIDLQGKFASPDMRWARGALPKLRRLSGGITGDVSLKGDVRSPDVTADLKIDDGEMSYTGLPLVSELRAAVTVTDERVEVKEAKGELGGAPFEFGGTVGLGGGEDPRFDLAFRGDGILVFRDSGIRLRADTDVTVRGPLSKLEIGGKVALVDSHYVKNIDFVGSAGGGSKPKVKGKGLLFSFQEPPLRDLVFDLTIKAKDPFLVKNQYVKGFIRPDLHLGGTGEHPVMLGKVYVDPFRIFVPAGVVRTEPGFVTFRPGEPDRPWLELRGRSRMMGYAITLRVEGFYDDPRMTFSSNPPLPDAELLMLVMTGTPPESGELQASGAAGSAMAVFLGRGFLSRFFGGGEETQEAILDRFETQVGRDITRDGDPTIDSQFRLTEDVLWEGGSLYLTSEKDRYDDFNYGVRFVVKFGNKKKEE
jgi:hypothetical protein